MSTRSERKQNRIDRYNELARKAETKSIEAFEHSNSICLLYTSPSPRDTR